jgi:chain length determinant protein (polysaccharide antigen chain regulator)
LNKEQQVSDTHKTEQVQYVPVQMMSTGMDDDEIDLLDLWRVLMDGKWIVMGVTLCCVLAGVGYAFWATPVFQVQTYFLPPAIKDVSELNVEGTPFAKNTEHYTPEKVYDFFLRNLRSRDLRRTFFQKEGLLDFFATDGNVSESHLIFERYFHERLELEKVGGKRSQNKTFYVLSFTGNDPEKAAQWVNGFVAHVMEHTRETLIQDALTVKNDRITYLTERIAGKRRIAREKREDQIARLKEALEIARKLHITRDRLAGSNITPAAIYDLGVSYLRGTKTLEAEIATLQNRKTDDPFIEGLRDLQEELEAVRNINIAAQDVRVAQVDQPASVPSRPIKPKKKLILALSGVGGLFLGVFVVFFFNFLKKAKHEEQDNPA